jgi:hypothetical protein
MDVIKFDELADRVAAKYPAYTRKSIRKVLKRAIREMEMAAGHHAPITVSKNLHIWNAFHVFRHPHDTLRIYNMLRGANSYIKKRFGYEPLKTILDGPKTTTK